MIDFEEQLRILSPEEIHIKIKQWSEKYPLEFDFKGATDNQLAEVLDLCAALTIMGDFGEASQRYSSIGVPIRENLTNSSLTDLDLDNFRRWTMVRIQFLDESKDDFLSIVYYNEVVDAYAVATPKFRIGEAKIKLQLIYHYELWKSEASPDSSLSSDKKHFLDELTSSYPARLEKEIQEFRENGEWETAILCENLLYKYYSNGPRPNETIRILKLMIEDLPKEEKYLEEDIADLNMDLGRVFAKYKKPKVARKYFQIAYDIFSGLGEEYEIFGFQAEALRDEMDNKT